MWRKNRLFSFWFMVNQLALYFLPDEATADWTKNVCYNRKIMSCLLCFVHCYSPLRFRSERFEIGSLLVTMYGCIYRNEKLYIMTEILGLSHQICGDRVLSNSLTMYCYSFLLACMGKLLFVDFQWIVETISMKCTTTSEIHLSCDDFCWHLLYWEQ